jgi:hypothetical protein
LRQGGCFVSIADRANRCLSPRPTGTRVGRLATRSDVRKAGRSSNRAARARLPRKLFRHPVTFWYGSCRDPKASLYPVLLPDGTEGLLPGYRYTYRFEVVLERDGQRRSDTQVVQVHAGDTVTLDFNLTDERIAQR